MSRTRQLGTSGSLLCRNSGAEPNVSAPSPTDRKRLVSALRSEGSSSITNTTGGSSGASFVMRHGTLANNRKNRSAAILQVAHALGRRLRWSAGRPTAPYHTIGPDEKEGVETLRHLTADLVNAIGISTVTETVVIYVLGSWIR